MDYRDRVLTDVLIIGAGVAGLSTAIELANRIEKLFFFGAAALRYPQNNNPMEVIV